MKRARLSVWGSIGLLVAGAAWWALQPEAATRPPEEKTNGAETAESLPRVHRDARAMRETLVEVTMALLRDDAKAIRAGLDRMEAACRSLGNEDREVFDSGIVNLDQALHRTLAGTRESSGAGDVDATFDEFLWTQKTCRRCHAHAREVGLLPATGLLW